MNQFGQFWTICLLVRNDALGVLRKHFVVEVVNDLGDQCIFMVFDAIPQTNEKMLEISENTIQCSSCEVSMIRFNVHVSFGAHKFLQKGLKL